MGCRGWPVASRVGRCVPATTNNHYTLQVSGGEVDGKPKKEIIKVGGNRISPKEIEEVIVSLPQVIDCTINAINDDLLGEAIEARIVVDNSQLADLDNEFFQQHCARHLAAHKIPKKIVIEDRLTISATGKKIK